MRLRRTIGAVILGGVLALGSAAMPPFAIDQADAKNPVGRFFNKVGDAIANNPLNKRRKRQSQPNTAPAADPAAAEEPVLSREDRRLIQSQLNALGHEVGPADGIFGNGTRRGIAEYQASLGAEATGYLTEEQANRLLASAPAPDSAEPAGQGQAGATAQPADTSIAEIAGPDAVWAPAAMASCTPEEMISCMERFGAPDAARDFVRKIARTGVAPGLLAGFDDFGTVDLASVRYLGTKRPPAMVLVNGGPAAVATENDAVRALPIDDPVYRRLVSRSGELKLLDEPRLESHRLMTRGEQRFVFAYRLAKCRTCATPGEMLVAFDFDAAGQYKGVKLIGIAERDPARDWLDGRRYDITALQNDGKLLQRRLAGLGFEPGPIDGKIAKSTEQALGELQASHGLRQSGTIDERTARVMAQPDIIVEISRFEQIYRIATEPDLIGFALRYGHGVLSRAGKSLPADNLALARMNSRIARLYDRKQDYQNALIYAQNAVDVSGAANREKSQSHGILLFNLGETYRNLDRKEEAVEQFDAAFDVFEPLAVAGGESTRQNLAAQALERTANKLIALYGEQGREWSAKRVKHRLETVEAQLAAAE
jgi:peptidoglycan hydrolase-like protein with peptidoglycan-binding domain